MYIFICILDLFVFNCNTKRLAKNFFDKNENKIYRKWLELFLFIEKYILVNRLEIFFLHG
jgi:hypothetical protein